MSDMNTQNLRGEILQSDSKALHDAAMSPDSLTFEPLSDKPFAELSISGYEATRDEFLLDPHKSFDIIE
jgi:hypothetical protein